MDVNSLSPKADIYGLQQLRGELIKTYRISRDHDCAVELAEFFELAWTQQLGGHPFKLQRQLVPTNVRRIIFSQSVVGA
ncbi:unnamed protein product [Schistocephalus solidus]|uniref:Group II intron reverse transcriptase/maturase n=1 Tax=Schistocephalus solidus TaxID=70667 RepID=A0A183TLM5_SCHSO|nr:unnamed protein product [Schistocephalus solidus]